MTKVKTSEQHESINARLTAIDDRLTNVISLADSLAERLNSLIITLPDPKALPPISHVVEELKKAGLNPTQAALEINHRGYRTSSGTGYQAGIIHRWMQGL